MQDILSEVTRLISESQKQYQEELDRNSDRSEYWRGKIDGLFAVKTLLQMQPDDDSEPDIIDLSDAVEPGDTMLSGIISKIDRLTGSFNMLHISAQGVTA